MMRAARRAALLPVIALIFAASHEGMAEEPAAPSVDAALEQLADALKDEKGLSPGTRDALSALVGALRAERAETSVRSEGSSPTTIPGKGEIAKVVDEYLTARPPVREPLPWEDAINRLRISGDLRLRHETTSGVGDRSTRNRERIRFRLGFTYEISDELIVSSRLITGDPDDPNSPHVTLGSFFDSFDVSLDRAFLSYRPQWADGAWVTIGKFGHSFAPNPVYGELVWDGDVQPEGIAAGYTLRDLRILDRLDVVVGEYIVIEQSNLDEASVFVAQVAGHKRLAEDWNLLSAIGWYRFTDLDPDGSLLVVADNRGNAVFGDGFQSRFSILNPIVALTYEGLRMPLVVSGEYIRNARAPIAQSAGWAVGVAYGETRSASDWRVYYQYQDIEREAVLSAIAQDDFTLATAFRGHLFGTQYQITDKIGLHAWGLLSEQRSSDSPGASRAGDDQWRFRIDLNIKF